MSSKDLQSDLAQSQHSEYPHADEKSGVTTEVAVKDTHQVADGGREYVITPRIIGAVLAVIIANEASLFSFLLPANLLVTINNDIGPSSDIVWVGTAWTLACAVLQSVAGRLSDIFGRRWVFQGGNILGLIGCCIGGTANNVSVMIVGTTLMGIGTSAQGLAGAGINEIVPKKYRGTATAVLTLGGIPGLAFSAPIANAVEHALGWRWAFYIGIILNGAAFIAVGLFYYPPDFKVIHPEGKTRLQQVMEFDFAAMGLLTAGLTLMLVGVSLGGNVPWASARVVATLVIGGLLVFVALPVWEICLCPAKIDKLFPGRLFAQIRLVTMPCVTILVSGMLFFSLQSLWPSEVQYLFTTDSRTLGWYSMAVGGGALVGGVVGALAFASIRHTKWQIVCSICFQSLFVSLMATVTPETPARAIAFVTLTSIGVGWAQSVAVLTVQLGAPDDMIGAATGMTGSIRGFGGSIAQPIYTTVVTNYVTNNYAKRVGASAVQAGLPMTSLESFLTALSIGDAETLSIIPGVSPAVISAASAAVKTVYSGAFRMAFLVAIVFAGTAIVASFFTASADHLLTNKINVTLDKPHLIGTHGRGEAAIDTSEDI